MRIEVSSMSPSVNGVSSARPAPLDVVVVGAGIGGLTAAIGLRRQGHNVTVLEKSHFAQEIGAAVHLGPNANCVLRRLGVFIEEHGAVDMRSLAEYSATGELLRRIRYDDSRELWQFPWHMIHRVDLHNALKKIATSPEGAGPPVQLRLANATVDVDCDTRTVFLANGDTVTGDVVVGADGVHSVVRKSVAGDQRPKSFGQRSFRFLVPKHEALEDPATAEFVSNEGEMLIARKEEGYIFLMYPCRGSTILNCAAVAPDDDDGAHKQNQSGWNTKANKDELVHLMHGFGPAIEALVAKADPEQLKIWPLNDLPELPTWVNRGVCLLGDAAHPFLPFQGQGAAQAIEDAASLSVVFPHDSRPDEVPDRLKLYERCRKWRASTVQERSRKVGTQREAILGGNDIRKSAASSVFTGFNFCHNEWYHSSFELRKWQMEREAHVDSTMPLPFSTREMPQKSEQPTFTTATVKFKTSKPFLENLLPTDAFSVQCEGAICHASFSITTVKNAPWLAGHGYSYFGLQIHDVEYTAPDGKRYMNTYLPVRFDDMPDAVIRNREELGLHSVCCKLEFDNTENYYHVKASWSDTPFFELVLQDIAVSEPSPPPSPSRTKETYSLAYRYNPVVGQPEMLPSGYPIMLSTAPEDGMESRTVVKTLVARESSFSFDEVEKEDLPTLYHIVDMLSEVPCLGVVRAEVVQGTGVSDFTSCMRI